MRDELDWLRDGVPPASDPDELVLRRARNRLVEEMCGGAHPPARARWRDRIAVLGSVAAALVLLAGAVWLAAGRDSSDTKPGELTAEVQPDEEPDHPATTTTAPNGPEATAPDLTPGLVGLSLERDLADGQLVSVTAQGVDAHSVWVAQCVDPTGSGSTGLDGCDLSSVQLGRATEQGSVTVEFRVRRHIEVDDTAIDCSTANCAVTLTRLDDRRRTGAVPITFDPAAPANEAPKVTVDLVDDLADGQELAVRGTGFAPLTSLRVVQCVIGVAEAEPNCLRPAPIAPVARQLIELRTDAAGAFDTSIFASRVSVAGPEAVDCADLALGGCVLAVLDVDGSASQILAVQPLHYDPSLAPPAAGVRVDPSSGLAEGSPATISITSLAELDGLEIELCVVDSPSRCIALPLSAGSWRGSTFSFASDLPRLLSTRDGHAHDCVLDGACELRLRSRGQSFGAVPLIYDPDAPLAPPLEIPFEPTGPFRPGETITLTLPPGQTALISQCVADVPPDASVWDYCDVYSRFPIGEGPADTTTGATGPQIDVETAVDHIGAQLAVFRRMILPDGRSHDCVLDGPCQLVVWPLSGATRFEPIPLVFDPGVDSLSDPDIEISKTTGLSDREEITVSVDGLPSPATLEIQLCPEETPIDLGCALVTRHRFAAQSDSMAVVLPRLTLDPATDRVHDCAEGCSLRVTNSRVTAEVIVDFDPEADLADPPALTADPATPVSGEQLTVSGAGFGNHASDPVLDSYVCDRAPDPVWTTLDLARHCLVPPDLSDTRPVVGADGELIWSIIVPGEIERPPGQIAHSCLDDECWLVVTTGARVAGPVLASLRLT